MAGRKTTGKCLGCDRAMLTAPSHATHLCVDCESTTTMASAIAAMLRRMLSGQRVTRTIGGVEVIIRVTRSGERGVLVAGQRIPLWDDFDARLTAALASKGE